MRSVGRRRRRRPRRIRLASLSRERERDTCAAGPLTRDVCCQAHSLLSAAAATGFAKGQDRIFSGGGRRSLAFAFAFVRLVIFVTFSSVLVATRFAFLPFQPARTRPRRPNTFVSSFLEIQNHSTGDIVVTLAHAQRKMRREVSIGLGALLLVVTLATSQARDLKVSVMKECLNYKAVSRGWRTSFGGEMERGVGRVLAVPLKRKTPPPPPSLGLPHHDHDAQRRREHHCRVGDDQVRPGGRLGGRKLRARRVVALASRTNADEATAVRRPPPDVHALRFDPPSLTHSPQSRPTACRR